MFTKPLFGRDIPRPVNTVPVVRAADGSRAVPGAAQSQPLTTAVPAFLMTLCAACRAAAIQLPTFSRMILSCKSCCIFTRFPHNMKTGPRLYPARRREPFGRVQARAFLFSAFVIFRQHQPESRQRRAHARPRRVRPQAPASTCARPGSCTEHEDDRTVPKRRTARRFVAVCPGEHMLACTAQIARAHRCGIRQAPRAPRNCSPAESR